MSSCSFRFPSLSKTIGITAVLCLSMTLAGCSDGNSLQPRWLRHHPLYGGNRREPAQHRPHVQFHSTSRRDGERERRYPWRICGFPAGHDDVNLPIVMGAKVNMEVTDKGATLSFNIKGKEKNVETDKLTPITKLSKALLKMFAGKTFNVEE